MNNPIITVAQQNFQMGNVTANTENVIATTKLCQQKHKSNIVLFQELTLTGYPPEDLLLRPGLYLQINDAIARLKKELPHDIYAIVSYPENIDNELFISVAVFYNGEIIAQKHKQDLANFSVFDEKRYFQTSATPCTFTCQGITFGVLICRDVWYPDAPKLAVDAGAQALLVMNASPFDFNKLNTRKKILSQRIQELNVPIVYGNCMGAQDELIFDGGSFAMNIQQQVCCQAPFMAEALINIEYQSLIKAAPDNILKTPSKLELIYRALKLGVHDYAKKNNFKKVIIGLSGGIDSALTLAIAVDALGSDAVEAVMMPSPYTSQLSFDDARQMAKNVDVHYHEISIEPTFEALQTSLSARFKGTETDTTEENLQARIRGTMLMAIANKFNGIVLATSNKSEVAVGYSTLYGDMVGGYAVLKDVSKTLVYELSNYRNEISPVIPQSIIDRPPTAELKHNQTDQDTLPDYDILDQILELYIEQDKTPEDVIAAGFDAETVDKVVKMIYRNEYKRSQAAPGTRITLRAFGKDRRYPITNGYIP